jgi:hypothetical protein
MKRRPALVCGPFPFVVPRLCCLVVCLRAIEIDSYDEVPKR